MGGTILVNPNPAEFANSSAVVGGRARWYEAVDVPGTLSIKTVLAGEGNWHANGRSFRVQPDTFLILNEGTVYSLDINSPAPTETFCVFFQPGLIEDVRASIAPGWELDNSADPLSPAGFFERLDGKDEALARALQDLRSAINNGEIAEGDGRLTDLAEILICHGAATKAQALQLQSAKSSTREEIVQRLNVGRDYALSNLSKTLSLAEVAQQACLSKFHFHRGFTAAFGHTLGEFIRQERMRRAKRLLMLDHPVWSVAQQCGYQSPTTFSRYFAEWYGVSPRAAQLRKIG